jgi:hypothetical protein
MTDTTQPGADNALDLDKPIWDAVTYLERQDATYSQRIAAADGLRALARRAAQPVESAGRAGELRTALRLLCNTALPVTNTAYNLGQSHEQWLTIKASIDALDAARSVAFDLIQSTATHPSEPAVPALEEGGPVDQYVAMLNSQVSRLRAENAKLQEALSVVPAVGGDTITLSGHQLRMALDLINPDGPSDSDQLDDWLYFGERQHRDDDGKEGIGMCCWNDDTDGVLPLDGEYVAPVGGALVASAEPVWIQLGQGKIEVGQGHHGPNGERLPAILFGRNGAGAVGIETEGDRVMKPGECIAAITFENPESLDVVAEKLAELRARIWPGAAPAGALVAMPTATHGPLHLTNRKTVEIAARGYNIVGYVLRSSDEGEVCISAESAVRWLPQAHYWRLMHEQDGSLSAAQTGSAAAPAEQTQAARDVLAERCRQVEQEGWTPEHDDAHAEGQMAGAAACYAVADITHWARGEVIKTMWPWALEWWKPMDRRRNLVKAGALILADIERLDRATPIPTGEKA